VTHPALVGRRAAEEKRRMPSLPRPLLLAAALLPLAGRASAQIAVVSLDNKVALVNGAVKVVANPPPDVVAIVDLSASPPKVLGQVEAPGSVVGPPFSVAVTPDGALALVTSSSKVDPADPTKQAPDDRVSVIDLQARPPAVVATLQAGKGASGVSINRQGTLALVANRAGGSVSVFTIQGKAVTPAGTVALGDEKSGPSHVAIAPDGATALVTRDGDDRISLLAIDGAKVEYAKRDLYAGLRPYGVDASAEVAAVANVGKGQGDEDTVSLVDLRAKPPRVVQTYTVGQGPEGLKLSPDGKRLAVVVLNGTNKPPDSPFHHDAGKLVLFDVAGTTLKKVAEAPIGRWSQGAAFTGDGRTVAVCNMVEKNLQVFRIDGSALREVGKVALPGGPVAIRTAERPAAQRAAR
jgi:DNA-binding beta-propeller fold protein YncE